MLKLTLKDIDDETPHIRVFRFGDAAGAALPSYSAGAHLEFDLGEAGSRAYSLIDWPETTSDYIIAVQREDAGQGGSKAMHALNVGDVVTAMPPKNDFPLLDGPAPILLLAGGIGITPMISMATQLLQDGRAFAFHYAGRSEELMGFSAKISENFADQVQLHFDDTKPLDLTALMGPQRKDTQLYICGPKGMIAAARSAAEAAGITDIHVELFATPQSGTDDHAFEVEIHESGQVFTIPPGKTIIEVLEDEGIDLMFDCQRGDCGICQTDVISGIPDHRDVVLSDEERAAGNVMQICVSRAKSPRLVLDI